MIIPIRCFTCGAVIGDKWEEYAKRVKGGESPKSVLDGLGVRRYCCRKMLLSHVDIVDELLHYCDLTQKRKRERWIQQL